MARCDILMYHMVSEPQTDKDGRFAIPPDCFETHIRGLATRGHQFVSLDQIADFLCGKASLPDLAVGITLDDGYQDNYLNAFPILEQYQVPASIFLVSGLMGDTNRWMDGRGFSRRRLMSWSQARELARHGIHLGGHTVNHVRLPELKINAARREIADGKASIENELGKEVRHFAYPYGMLDDVSSDLVRESGFRTASSTRPGPNTAATNPFILRRIEIFGTDSFSQLIRKMRFGTNDSGLDVPLRYYWSRLKSYLS